ncbi:hypothetical protein D918_06998 [Trichuris suis]|nr:hypothetical protein D918_06998 [Trichuris suis]
MSTYFSLFLRRRKVRQGEELSFNFVKRVKMQPEQRERSRNDGCEFTSLLAGSSTYQRRRDFRKEKGPRNVRFLTLLLITTLKY